MISFFKNIFVRQPQKCDKCGISEEERENVMSLLNSTELNIDYKKLKKVFDKSK